MAALFQNLLLLLVHYLSATVTDSTKVSFGIQGSGARQVVVGSSLIQFISKSLVSGQLQLITVINVHDLPVLVCNGAGECSIQGWTQLNHVNSKVYLLSEE